MQEQEIPITAKQTGYAMKICGMKYSENILEVAALLPDYMGFIFWEPSSRYFTGTIPTLPTSIKKVGVFVNASVTRNTSKSQPTRFTSRTITRTRICCILPRIKSKF